MEFEFKNKAMLSPMAGFTDIAFREMCLKYGACLVFPEFISANAICQNNSKTKVLMKIGEFEKPSAIQLFGNDTDVLKKAIHKIKNDFNYIDLNCGCPVKKLTKNGSGSELLKNPKEIENIILAMKSEFENISIKIRLGINDNSKALEIAKIAEKVNLKWITVHGRNQKQAYSGKANWDEIKKIKEAVTIPVIGNGDVTSPEDFKEKLEKFKVDAIMIGRGALGNPYLFKQINDYMEFGKYDSKPRLEQFFEYIILAKKYNIKFPEIKNHSMFFTKGLIGGAELRTKLAKTENLLELETLILEFENKKD